MINDSTASDEILSSLPPTWPVQKEAESHQLEAKRYEEFAARLSTLANARAQARARLAHLRRAHAALRPFAATDHQEAASPEQSSSAPSNAIQQNLITRDGDVERELARMRVLLARVSGRIAALPPLPPGAASSTLMTPGHDFSMAIDSPAEDERRRVNGLLERL